MLLTEYRNSVKGTWQQNAPFRTEIHKALQHYLSVNELCTLCARN